VYSQFGDYITVSKLQFIVENPYYFWIFARGALLNGNAFLFIGAWLLIAWLWGPARTNRGAKSRIRSALGLMVLVAIYLVALNQIRFHTTGRHLTIDSSFAVAVKNLRKTSPGGVYASTHYPVAPYSPKTPCNVLVIINESFGKTALMGESESGTPMPFLRDWMLRDSSQFVAFQHAYTVASVTDLSVPSIVTGIAPYQSPQKLHTMPFIWDWAAAGGYYTVMVSAQLCRWANFDQFFCCPGPALFVPAEQMDEPVTNDTGVDELVAIHRFCDALTSTPAGRPFCAIYNSNALHYPFHSVSRLQTLEPRFRSKYKNAAMMLDAAFRILFDSLNDRGLIENTLIIISSDHGESDSLVHPQVHRLYSFYDEIMSIPLLVRIPDSWLTRNPERAATLKANSVALVSNLDIVPTVADFMGADQNQTNSGLLDSLPGQSLFDPVSEDRRLVSLNTNELRLWEHEGFGIYWRSKRFVYSDVQGPQLFDVAIDSLQMINLWPAGASADDSAIVRLTVDSLFDLKRIWGGGGW
jgi:phosphoglycerol transferase MdoB-like AlkP superfamily enzyme